MEKIEPGVWQGTYRGRMYRVVRCQRPPWGKVPRLPTFTYHTCGMYCEDITSWGGAEDGAMQTIENCIAREREEALRRWYRKRFNEAIDETAAAPFDKRAERFRELTDVELDPGSSATDAANAYAAFHLIYSLGWRRWFQEQFYETIEEAEAAPPDKRAERIRKLETMRDHPRTPAGEVANAKAVLERMQAGTKTEAA